MADERGPKWGGKICVKEEFKIAVKIALDKFRVDENQKDLEFPSSFTATERAYVHRICQKHGLKSKSQGKGANRFLVASKKEVKRSSSNSKIKLCQTSNQCIEALMKKFPLNTKEKLELFPKTDRLFGASDNGKSNKEYKFIGKLSNTPPQVPPPHRDNDLVEFRKSLPIYSQRNDILTAIEQNQVVMISGETGSGKTTQVTQFILENASNKSQPCRIICTQPRRISALSVAERVATERGEKIAQTVGYQIRLDSRVSGKTVLSYCTNGVLLRTLMQADDSLSYITHIIVDEIHERDRFADFLLISLRDILSVNKKIKLILMSAALDINLFVEYFGNCPVIHVPGRCFEVKEVFLEDILGLTGYQNKGMKKHFKDGGKVSSILAKTAKDLEESIKTTTIAGSTKSDCKDTDTDKDCTNKPSSTLTQDKPFESQYDEIDDILPENVGILLPEDDTNDDIDDDDDNNNDDGTDDATDDNGNDDISNNGYDGNDEGDDIMIEDDDDDDEVNDGDDDAKELAKEVKSINLEPTSNNQIEDELNEEDVYLRKEMDESISEAWLNGSDDSFVQILHLIMNENISVDYQHSETQVTSLMVAAGRGCAGVVEQLILLGANPHITDPKNGWSALDWAKKWENADIVEMLETYIASPQTYTEDIALEKQDKELSEEVKELLAVYHKTFDDDKVDLDLIVSILNYICSLGKQGAVLVFLPGYDEIMKLRDSLSTHSEYGNSSRYQLFMLHSSMQPSEQRKVFRKLPSTVRKIILSTNIAETSVTIDDVVFVIDSGKVKEKSFDALTSVSTLHPVWISKASSIQRKGRAGRCSPGVCFHLFSHARFESFQSYQVPEMLRTPLQELCLHTKLLSGPNTSIADFLAKAPEPPAYLILRNAVTLLKTIDALDNWEDLTDLGRHLADLPLEPPLGKMVLYSVILKCIDPVITIACALAYRDPFVLPMYAAEKHSAALAKKKFIIDPYSDHLLFVKAFRGWQRAKADGYDKSYCQRNYLSPATLEMMAGMRSQMIVHLKACGFIRPRGAGDMRDLNTNSNNWAVVKAALCAGMYPNIVRVDHEKNKLTTLKESKVRLHTSSILYEHPDKKESMGQSQAKAIQQIPTDWLIYEEMTRMHVSVSIKCCTAVSPITVSLFSGPSLSSPNLESGTKKSCDQDRKNSEGRCNSESSDSENDESNAGVETRDEQAEFKVDDWISLCGNDETVHLTTYLRHKLQALFIRRIRSPSRPWSQVDEAIVRATVAILSAEEELINPSLYPKQRKPRQDYSSDSRTRDERPRPVERFSPRDRLRDSPVPSWRSNQTNSPVPQANNRRSVETSSQFVSQSPASQKFSDARYFIIKCNNQRNLSISMAKGIWATTIANEKKLNRAYRECKKIVLIFSVQGSGHFQGFAHMASPIGKEKSPEFGSSSLGGVFKVDWIKKANIPFQEAHHLVNPWNDHKKVQISRDGQELEPTVGAELCKLWDANTSQYSRAPVQSSRRGQRSHQQDQNPNHWQQSQSPTPLASPPQMYAPHAASMPIPVPIPSQHAHGTVMQRFPSQGLTGMNQAPIGYTAHPVAMQPNPNMAAAMRYPSNAPVIGLQFQQGGPTGAAVLRPNSYPS